MEVETAQDPNFHLRNELLRDIKDQCNKLGSSPDIIIISGDIAFAGHPDEFLFATRWLKELCSEIGAELESVFVCPGNHDAVRTKADAPLVQLIHNEFKRQDLAQLNHKIGTTLLDPTSARLLYDSLENYNAFALQFFCDLLPPERTRARRDLLLNDGSTLRLWGLNTAFVSSSADKEGDIFIDPASLQITRHDGVTNAVIAHHDLPWIRQKRELEDHLQAVAKVQIFGHVHTNRIVMNRDFLRLTASAAHPDRQEPDWEPGYNLLELEVEGKDAKRRLRLRTHVRVWQTSPAGFRAKMDKDVDVFEHYIDLEKWTRPAGTTDKGTPIAAMEKVAEIDITPPDHGPAMTQLRELGLRFYQLPFSKKAEIAGKLNLLEEEDTAQPDYERFRRVFIRAHERGQVEQLEAAVKVAEGAGGSNG